MTMLTDHEFDQIERLLARLLPDATPSEETTIPTLHERLRRIHAAQSGLRDSRERLLSLQGPIGQEPMLSS